MSKVFSNTEFLRLFPTDESCLEEIKMLRFPKGIPCSICKITTKHYKVQERTAYACEYCRHQVYPLVGTIFERSSTSLRLWFYCMFLLTQSRGKLSIRELQQSLGVTYKTAWRMQKEIINLMKQNNADLLAQSEEVIKWTIFGAFEFKVVQKKDASE